MGVQCGIVGLPNVGKSTLFNALTKAGIQAENYPFCTIEPNVGIVEVPDDRLAAISQWVNPQQIIPAVVEFVDIAGLVAGASEGEGLGNRFLSHIRQVQAIVHVVRCFDDDDVTHVSGRVDPLSDIATIETELALADLQIAEKALEKQKKQARSGDKEAKAKMSALEQWIAQLNDGKTAELPEGLEEYGFIMAKPILYVGNIPEGSPEGNPHWEALSEHAEKRGAGVLAVSARIEAEIQTLDPEDQELFMSELNMTEPGLNRLIREAYSLLDLQTFFTAGIKEVRAWTMKKGTVAPMAAGVIHTDFIKGFIRAEVIEYNDFIQDKGEQGAKEKGHWRLEGKDYVVQDGDVVHFRVNA